MEKKSTLKAPVKTSSKIAKCDMLPPPEFNKLSKFYKKLTSEQIGSLFIGVVFVIFIIPFSVIATLDDTDSRSKAYLPRPASPPWTPQPPVSPPWTPRPTIWPTPRISPVVSPWPTPRMSPRPSSTPRSTPAITPWPRPSTLPTPRMSPRPLPTISPVPVGPNDPPRIVTKSFRNATVNQLYQTTVSATDANPGDSINIEITSLPAGVRKGICSTRIIANNRPLTSCTISGIPNTAGLYRVYITAYDNRGGVTKLTTPLRVNTPRFRWPWEPPIPLPTPITEAR